MTYDEIFTATNKLVEELSTKGRVLSAKDCFLDPRCGDVVIGDNWIATRVPHQLEYYSPVMYVSSSSKIKLGDLTIYSAIDGYIQDILDYVQGA